MSDILGPANAPNSVTVRPVDTRTFGSLDTHFTDCTAPDIEDGTDVQAAWLNGVTAALRGLWRMNGNKADGVTPIVTENGADDGGLAKAIQQLLQRGQPIYAADSGAVNALVVSLTPALIEYKAGLRLLVKIANSNTGPATITVNGVGVVPVVRFDGAPLLDSDLLGGSIETLVCDGTKFYVPSARGQKQLTRNLNLYVDGVSGNDANDGSSGHALATLQAAANLGALYGPGPYTVNVSVADYANYAPAQSARRASADMVWTGNAVTPSNVEVKASGVNQHCFFVNGPNTWTVKNLKASNSDAVGGGGCFVASGSGATINTENTVSGVVASGSVWEAYGGANCNVNGNHVFAGNFALGLWAMLNGILQVAKSTVFNFSTPVACSQFAQASMGGALSFSPPNATFVNAGNLTGQKYNSVSGGIINVNGAGTSYLPGSVAGASPTGVYI